ncbi:fumble [Saitoella complicata NRRL Y-17804]|uniref:fumble n=1 Tax=Saitoella complicata (strain BCRC 22490 / CBS 7301 / JCM 7358 / NBRC 10748 / NRRL Y-17804) TaxID=698492 RepID=UPI000866F7BF|nr:fumble [Saitoella complicata NRRL Y-17804]ODQ50579.1 fumble [Saitoella complicata NRRL Y-17804]
MVPPKPGTPLPSPPRPSAVRINVSGAKIVDSASEDDDAGNRDIRLPNHTKQVSHIAVDIGGTLAKVVFFNRAPEDGLGGRLNFTKFETDDIEDCIAFLKQLVDSRREQQQQPRNTGTGKKTRGGRGSAGQDEMCVMATGGGAYLFYDRLKSELGCEIVREDEMECLISGLDFFITEIPDEVFTYSEENPMAFEEPREDIYPYLLVNIGSGVSMIKVSGPGANEFERIGGSSLGGGTLWGLLSLLTGAKSFDDMLEMSQKGDNTAVDMLVGDIYGTDYGRIGLKSTTIASTFGKVFKKNMSASNGTGKPEFKPEDISKSLLFAISNNIGQIAYLQATKHDIHNIYFGGSFIRGHTATMNTLSYAIRFWSQGSKRAYFLRHEGYLGAVGAFLRHQPRNWGRRKSFGEDGGQRIFQATRKE